MLKAGGLLNKGGIKYLGSNNYPSDTKGMCKELFNQEITSMFDAIKLDAIMLDVIMLDVIMLDVIMLDVIWGEVVVCLDLDNKRKFELIGGKIILLTQKLC